MNFSNQIVTEYRRKADKRVAYVCRMMIAFILSIALLNIIGVFIIEPVTLYVTVAISVIDFFLPTLFYRLCEEISVKTKTVIKTLLWSGMKNLPLLFIYSIQRIL